MQRTMGRHIRAVDDDDLTHLDRVLLPILRRLTRERPPEAGPVLLGVVAVRCNLPFTGTSGYCLRCRMCVQ